MPAPRKICYGYIKVPTDLEEETFNEVFEEIFGEEASEEMEAFKETFDEEAFEEEKIIKYARSNGYEVKNIYVDKNISSNTMEQRNMLKKMLEELKEGYYVITASVSSLCVTLKDALEIRDIIKSKGAHLVVLDMGNIDIETPSGEMMFKFASSLNEFQAKEASDLQAKMLSQ